MLTYTTGTYTCANRANALKLTSLLCTVPGLRAALVTGFDLPTVKYETTDAQLCDIVKITYAFAHAQRVLRCVSGVVNIVAHLYSDDRHPHCFGIGMAQTYYAPGELSGAVVTTVTGSSFAVMETLEFDDDPYEFREILDSTGYPHFSCNGYLGYNTDRVPTEEELAKMEHDPFSVIPKPSLISVTH